MHVEGHGIHDNGVETDADSMLRDFAGQLRIKGHTVQSVSFSAGSTKTLPISDTGSVEAPPDDWEQRP